MPDLARASARASALATVSRPGVGPDCGVRLSERPADALVQVAVPAAARAAVADALGHALPDPLTAIDIPGKSTRLLWVSADQWWVEARDGTAPADLAARLAAAGARPTDQTQARVVVHLAGEHTRDLLAKGWALDLHPRAFPAGACAQSSLAAVSVMLAAVGGGAYDLYIPRSFAQSLWDWLLDAGAEFGVGVD
ncbi:MAG: hypothetical protein KDE22_11325 [Rhodobacterales bacterium]|nr:hypothetical protein [Rhodobacterales bacterium]